MASLPKDAVRLRSFSRFFKNYMSISAVITSSLPIPVAAFRLIPVFDDQRGVLSVYASLFCFLVFAYVFFCRHSFARWFFPFGRGKNVERRISSVVPLLPILLVIASAACTIEYHLLFNDDIQKLKIEFAKVAATYGDGPDIIYNELPDGTIVFSGTTLLHIIRFDKIPMAGALIASYIGIFVFSESAFVIMALKEYLQDTLGLSDAEIISRSRRKAAT